jgi:hypothetical protein
LVPPINRRIKNFTDFCREWDSNRGERTLSSVPRQAPTTADDAITA